MAECTPPLSAAEVAAQAFATLEASAAAMRDVAPEPAEFFKDLVTSAYSLFSQAVEKDAEGVRREVIELDLTLRLNSEGQSFPFLRLTGTLSRPLPAHEPGEH